MLTKEASCICVTNEIKDSSLRKASVQNDKTSSSEQLWG